MRFIIKPESSRDEYVEWSSIVEAPTRIGSRKDFLRELGEGSPGYSTADRLDLADINGTTSPLDGGWSESLIFEQRGTIACAKLSEFTRLLFDGDLQGALRLCEPFEDLDHVRGLDAPSQPG